MITRAAKVASVILLDTFGSLLLQQRTASATSTLSLNAARASRPATQLNGSPFPKERR
jgi:hypothetical protein